MTGPDPALDLDEAALRKLFEAQASDPSYKFRRSRRGTYVNGALARDWKWFKLGAQEGARQQAYRDDPAP